MQFQSDIVGLPVRRPQMVETTALGAAGLAGIGAGIWTDADDYLGTRAEPTRFSPAATEVERKALIGGWRRAVSAAISWADSETG
jgi:glycerol kinase